MLKNRIVDLCQLEKITVKKMTLDLGFTEQSIYRWFKENNMEIKHLQKIADYFKVDINYFFVKNEDSNNYQKKLNERLAQIREPEETYNIKDKYIKVLEENMRLQHVISDMNGELEKCKTEIESLKTKQPA